MARRFKDTAFDKLTITQAERVMYRFGGPKHLALLLKKIGKPRDASNLYRWTYPKSRGGTGGLVPGDVWPDIFVAARLEGIILTLEDTDPREIYIKDWDGKNK